MTELTLSMFFDKDEISSIEDYCLEKKVSIHDMIRAAILDKLYV